MLAEAPLATSTRGEAFPQPTRIIAQAVVSGW